MSYDAVPAATKQAAVAGCSPPPPSRRAPPSSGKARGAGAGPAEPERRRARAGAATRCWRRRARVSLSRRAPGGAGRGTATRRAQIRTFANSAIAFCVGPLESWDHPVAALRLAAARDDDQDGLLALVQEMAARVLHEAYAAIANDDRQTDRQTDADADADVAAAAAAGVARVVRARRGGRLAAAFESARCRAMSALVADAAAAAIADTENARFERFVAADGSDRTRSDDDAREPPRENDRRAKTMARLRARRDARLCARAASRRRDARDAEPTLGRGAFGPTRDFTRDFT